MTDPDIQRLLDDSPHVPERPNWDIATVLVTVKAYPGMTRKAGEAVCVAGIRLDGESPSWFRMFPVGFRKLPQDRQFAKYQVVRLRVQKGTTDRRPESYKPDLDSLAVGPKVGSGAGAARWRPRHRIVEPLLARTTACELLKGAQEHGGDAPSLGLVRPVDISDLSVNLNPDYDPAQPPRVDADLFGQVLNDLQVSPVEAKYHYRCEAKSCKWHHQTIIDWESGRLARRNLSSGVDEMIRRHRERFFDQLCSAEKDTHFYIGNQHQHPVSFMVLGLYYPPNKVTNQPTLEW